MGFYIRDSIRVGPFRFNLSKSGVGVSVGVRGARVGSGPRGNYVHMGAHGLYYRATLPPRGGRAPAPALGPGPPTDELHDIESASVAEMRDLSSAELLREIDEKRRTARGAPMLGFLGALVAAGAGFLVPDISASLPPEWPGAVALAAPGVLLALTVVGVVVAHRRDVLAKTVVLFYELEPAAERTYKALHDAFGDLLTCHAVWHVEAAGATGDWKRSGGATTTLRRKRVSLACSAPPDVATNIAVPRIPCGRQTVYLFPDRVLVFSPEGVGAVSYSDLSVVRGTTRFVEDGGVPGDTEVVGSTWQYVNRNGGPDRRFNSNRQIPVVLYEEMHLRSGGGLNELFQLSRQGAVERFGKVAASLAGAGGKDALPAASSAPDAPVSIDPNGPEPVTWVGSWGPLFADERATWEQRFRESFPPPSPLAGLHARALGREMLADNALYSVPDAASPLVVVHFRHPDSAGHPTYTYYQGPSAWNKWARSGELS